MAGKSIIFVEDEDGPDMMVVGYDDDYAGMIALLVYLRSRFRAQGQDLELFPLDDEPDDD